MKRFYVHWCADGVEWFEPFASLDEAKGLLRQLDAEHRRGLALDLVGELVG